MELRFYEEISPKLPHPHISLGMLLVVENAMVKAWEILREGPRQDLQLLKAPENTVTHALYETLYDIVFNSGLVEGFDRQLFTVVTRDAKLRTFDGRSLDKMPDLLVGLVGRDSFSPRSQDWLFIECKPVDRDHSVGVHYCDKGLIRFVNGDYAWAMQEAMMVGYACEGYTISPKLGDALTGRPDAIPTIAYPRPCGRSMPTRFAEAAHASTHKRIFRYLGTCTDAPLSPSGTSGSGVTERFASRFRHPAAATVKPVIRKVPCDDNGCGGRLPQPDPERWCPVSRWSGSSGRASARQSVGGRAHRRSPRT